MRRERDPAEQQRDGGHDARGEDDLGRELARALAQAERVRRPQHDREPHAQRPARRRQRGPTPWLAVSQQDRGTEQRRGTAGPLRGARPRAAGQRRAGEDRDRRQRQHQQRVDRAAVAQREIDQRVKAGDAGRAEREQQAPVAPDRLPAAPQRRANPRQQQRKAERPAQQVQRGRVDLVAQRAAGYEVAGPEKGGPREREDRPAVAHQCAIAAAASARRGIA
jgi:hypothetical protein